MQARVRDGLSDTVRTQRAPRHPLGLPLKPLTRAIVAAGLLASPMLLQAAGPVQPLLPLAAGALPTGLQVKAGQAAVQTLGNQMLVRNSNGAILNWKSFDIGAAAAVRFEQANAASKVLNRVTGDDPSRILGQLSSNGQVWLVNPNGVLFGQGARVDVASLVASTLRLGDSDFLAQRYRFAAGEANAALLRNEGTLQSSFGGQVLLLGGRVENAGDIQAPGGQVGLVAARSVELVDTALPNLSVRVDLSSGEVLNLGRIAAPGGRVDVYGAIVNQQGFVSAASLGQGAEGQLVLRATDSLTLGADSRTEATGLGAGLGGGDVTLQGRDVVLAGGAVVDASGDAAGGRIRLGGGLQGRDAGMANAATVQVHAGATLAANALGHGHGGQVVVWSDQGTVFDGALGARGGLLGGDGGFAEVSSKGQLSFGGVADLRAQAGRTGSLLLDPANLTIAASGANLSGNGGDLDSGSVLFSEYPRTNSIITAGALNSQLALGNVVLQASNDITVNSAVNGSNALTLQAGRNIVVNSALRAGTGLSLSANDPGGSASGVGVVQMASTASLDAGSGALTISNNGGNGTHRLAGALSAGTLSIQGAVQLVSDSTWTLTGNSTVSSAISGSYSLTKAGAGTLTLGGSSSYSGGTTVAQGTLATAAGSVLPDQGTVTVAAGANLALGGNDTIGALAGAGHVALGTAELESDTATSSSFSGQISGAGSLVKQGSGWLTLSGSNTYTGMTTVRTDSGRLIISGSGAALPGALTIDGGRVVFNNSSALTLPSLSMVGGWLSGTGDVTVSGPFTVSGTSAEVNGSGRFTTQGTSSINLSGVVGGFLGISKPWTNTGSLTLAGDDFFYFGYSQGNGGSLTNAAGATLTLATSAANAMSVYTGSSNVLNNAGTLKQIASGAHALNLNTFSNTGTVELQAGTLSIAASGSDTGSYALGSGTVLALSTGTRTFGDGVAVSGAGTLQVSGATLNVETSSPLTLPNLGLAGGTLGGAGQVIVSGAFDVTGTYANLTGSGTLTTQGTSTVNLANVNGGYLGVSRNWVNQGTLTIGGNDFVYLGYPSGGTITLTNDSGATLNLSSSYRQPIQQYTGATTVLNTGTLNQTASGSHGLGAANFHNTGTVNAQAGTLAIDANGSDTGSYSVASGATLEFSSGTRVLAASTNISGAGSLQVSGGTTTIQGAMDLANTGAAIGVSSGTLNLGGSASGNFAPVAVSGGTLNFNNASAVTLPSLALTGGTLGGSGDVTVRGAFDVTGTYAYLTGSGTLTTQGTSTVNLANVNGGYLGVSRNWVNQGTLTIGGNDFVYLGYPSGGTITLTNDSGATLNLSSSYRQPIQQYTGATTVLNTGTLNQTASGSHGLGAANFHNTGTVNAQAGTLAIDANGSDTGSYSVASGATLEFSGGTRVLAASTNIAGAGSLLVSGGTTTIQGAMDLANTGAAIGVSSGTLNFGGSASGNFAPVTVSGGTLNFNNASAVTLPSLALTGGTLGGSGDVTVRGAFDVTGTYANLTGSGTLTTQGTSTVNLANVNGGYLGVSRNWVNQGTLTIGGNDFVYLGYPSGGTITLTNDSGATLNLSSSYRQPIQQYTGATTVLNTGTLNQTASGSHGLGAANFHNTGTVNAQAGTLAIDANGSDTGSYSVASGATLEFSSGTRVLAASTNISGAGSLLVSGGTTTIQGAMDLANTGAAIGVSSGTLNFGGSASGNFAPVTVSGGTLNFNNASAVTLPSLALTGGTLGGSGDVTVGGAFDVTGTYAYLTGSGTLTTQGTSTVNLANVNGGYLGVNRNWVNQGTLSFGGDDFAYFGLPSGGTFTLTNASGATLNLNGSASSPWAIYSGTPSIVNEGTLNQNAAGRHTVTVPFSNRGTVNVNAGSLVLAANGSDSGRYALAEGSTLEVSGGTRSLASGASVSGTGSMAVSNGVLNVDGALDFSATAMAVSGGTLNFNNASAVTLPSLALTGGTVGGSGDVTVRGAFDVTGTYAYLSGSGTLTTQGTSTVNLANVNGGYLGVNRNWVNQGTLSFGGDDFAYFGLPSGGTFTLTNASGATLNLNGSASNPWAIYSGTPSIVNEGTLNQNAAGRHMVTVPFSNRGTVNVNAGSLVLAANGSDSGRYALAEGSTLEVSGGTRSLASGASVSGTGSMAVSNGVLNVDGALDFSATAMAVSGGTLNFNNASAVTLPSLALTGGTLGGSGDVTVRGAFDVTGTYAYLTGSGTLTTQGTSAVNLANVNGGYVGVNRNWVNQGTLSFGGDDFAYFGLPSGGTFTLTNASGATLNLNGNASNPWAIYSGTPSIVNEGTLNQNAAGRHMVTVPFSNRGTVNVNAGSLVLAANGSDSGRYALAEGSTLEVSGGTRSLASGASVSGTGSMAVSNGVLNVDGALDFSATAMAVSGGTLNFNNASAVTLPSLALTGGTVGGSGDVTVRGAFDVTGTYANLTGSGTLTTQGTSTVDLANVRQGYLNVSRRWQNAGALNVSGDDLLYLGASGTVGMLVNQASGVATLSSSAPSPVVYNGGSSGIDNAGTLTLTASGTHSLSTGSFVNSGQLLVPQGNWTMNTGLSQRGTLDVNSGASFAVFGNVTNERGGTLSGNGTLVTSGTLTNLGSISPGGASQAGTLTIDGNLTMAGGSLDVDLGGTAAGASDKLVVTGNVRLGGALRAQLIGGYQPAINDYLPVVTVGRVATGAFSSTDLAGFTAGYNLATGEAARLIYSGSGTKVFTNAANNLDWSTAANWDGALPGSNDSVLISSGHSVSHADGTDTVAALTIASNNALTISGGSLAVTGATALDGRLTVSGTGAATLNGDMSGSGRVQLQGGSLTLNGAATMAELNVGTATLGGQGSLQVDGVFVRNPGSVIRSDFSQISLTQTSGSLTPGALSAGRVSLVTRDSAGSLNILERVASAGDLTVTAAGAMRVEGATAALAATGNLNVSALTLDLAAPLSGQRLVVQGTNSVRLRDAAVLTAAATSGDAIVLDAAGSGPFINEAGASAMVTGGGRWLVYSADPRDDTVGGLDANFRQYNAPYGATVPQGEGNGLLYSLAPRLTIGLQGLVSKVYDGSAAASLAGSNFGLSGALPIDRVSLTTPAEGRYLAGNGVADKDVGGSKTVQASGLGASAVDSVAGYPVYGLQVNSTASADIGRITQATLLVDGLAAADKVYDATRNASLTGAATVTPLGTDSVRLAGTASGLFADKNVGTAKAVSVVGLSLGGTDAGNYTLQLPALVASISTRDIGVDGIAVAGKVYDAGTAASFSRTGSIAALAGDDLALAGTPVARFADKNVGNAKTVNLAGFALTGSDAGNYRLLAPASTTADITAATLVLGGFSAADKVYDAGRAASLIGSASIAPLAGDSVSLAGTASGQFADKNVGTAKPVTVSGLSLTGTDAGNYTLQVPALSAGISARPLAVDGVAVVGKVYDGGTAATLLGAGSVTGLAGDNVALAGTQVARFADKIAGTAKTVSLSGFALTGNDAGNYALQAPASTTADIAQAALAVSGLTALGKVYDTTTAATLGGNASVAALAGDNVALAGTAVGRYADKNVGTAKAVTVSGLSLAGADAGNYALQPVAGLSADITPATLQLGGLSAADKVYDASRAAVLNGSASVAPLAGDSLSLAGSATGLFADKNVGTAKTVALSGLTLSGADAGNYTLQLPALVASIQPATAQLLNLAAETKVYDGGTAVRLSGGLGGMLGGDAVTLDLTGQFASAAAGVARDVNWTAQLRGPDALNYRLPAVSGTVQAAIQQAVLSYVANQVNGSSGQPLPTLGGSLTGFVAGETQASATTGNLLWSSAATSASPAGSYAVSGSGLQAANYRFEQAPGNATALVLQAPATADPATSATTVVTTAALIAVQPPLAMSTPVQGRVLDVTLAMSQPDSAGQRALASLERGTTEQAALPATSVAAVNAQRSADELRAITQRLGAGLADEGEAMGYKELDLSRLPRDEVLSLLAARARYKLKVFSNGVHRVQQDPALADVRPCVSAAELGSGICIITDQLKREIQAEQAKAAQIRQRQEKMRNVKSAALPAIERKLALVIGINKYADRRIPELTGAVPDARALRDMLQQRLGYEPTVVENANREAIIKAFNKLALEAEPNDSVIVYYAGHGVVVPVDGADTGFWVPSDGDSDKPATWMSNADIARMVAAIGARQVMLVSDSCYSGRLVGGDRLQNSSTEADEMLKRRAVVVMSSGGDEPVADQGRNGHSVFAWHFMRALEGLDAWQAGGSLYGRVRQAVVKDFPQTPQYGASQGAGHEGNTDYLFERRELQAIRP